MIIFIIMFIRGSTLRNRWCWAHTYSNVDAIQGKLRVVIDKKKLAQNTNLYENIELLTSYEINNLIIEADYYTKC